MVECQHALVVYSACTNFCMVLIITAVYLS